MKKTLLLVTSLIALQTAVYANCSGCTPFACRKDQKFSYCEENCSEDPVFAGCLKSHDAVAAAAAKKAEQQAKIEAEYQENLAAATANETAE